MASLTPLQIQLRFNNALDAHQHEIEKFTLIDAWYTAYEKHLRLGEDWNEKFRFPELFGAVQRKYDNLIEFWPEMQVRSDGDSAVALQQSYDHNIRVSNVNRERNRALFDAVKTGWGVIEAMPVRWERTFADGKEALQYDGFSAKRIDPRDFIPAHSALVMHDHTGREYCPYVFKRTIYYVDTFKSRYQGKKGYKNIENVKPTTYDGAFNGDRYLTERESAEKQTGDYVSVIEYWDMENDIFEIYANEFSESGQIYKSPNGIPFEHKQLPFHMYYNYRRFDSIYGVGEVELNMPYNLFREEIMNLMIDNIKLELQPAYLIAGGINFNSEEQELQPGALFNVEGLTGGKLQDNIMPFRAGGVTADVPAVVSTVEDSRIVTTGDDTRSLYANPQQLATQTLAKREALQKRIRGNVMRNAYESEWYFANQLTSYIQCELSKPFKDKEGKTTYRKIKVKGFRANQDKKEARAKFMQEDHYEDEFYLNGEVSKEFDKQEIEIVNTKLNEQIKRDEMQNLIMFMQQVMSVAQTPEGRQILGGMQVDEFLKQIASELSLDISKMFPMIDKDKKDTDLIDYEHDQIANGVVPNIKEGENSEEHLKDHYQFMKSPIAKKLSAKAKKALMKHIQLTIDNVQKTKAGQMQLGQGGIEFAPEAVQQKPVQGMGGVMGGQAQAPGAAGSPIPTQA